MPFLKKNTLLRDFYSGLPIKMRAWQLLLLFYLRCLPFSNIKFPPIIFCHDNKIVLASWLGKLGVLVISSVVLETAETHMGE